MAVLFSRLLRRLPAHVVLLFVAALSAPAALAQTWPANPITMVMTFPAGSGVDVVARQLQPAMEQALGTRIVIDYRPGAGGNVASEHVAHARPDGYTILFGTAATHGINAALYRKLPFDVEADFTPISPVVDVSNVLTVNPDVIDAKSVKEFIELVRANPGKYNYASTGNGTGTHLAFAEFNAKAGLNMVHVPYKGGPEALQAVLRGEVCCIFNQVQTVLAQWRAGKVRLLGVTTPKRVSAVADIPTIAEAALPGFDNYTWFGIFAPKGLDPQIAERLNLAVKAALETPAIRQKLIDSGNTPRYETLAQFRETVRTNRIKWAEVVKASGATVD
ncbi:MAG TPA: tripartite tricarboxylate transporter substrate binding protein [Burkholderiaceae bacterium]|nr:tripartite tricarboxylate transporter substrate binding protein [Burkholderiaceae bacterium]